MKKIIFVFPLLVLLFSCGQSESEKAAADSLQKALVKDSLRGNITKAEKVLNDKNHPVDMRSVNNAINAYSAFTNKYPEDTLTPEYLLRLSQEYGVLQNFQQSAAVLEVVLDRHPNFKRYPDALWMAANIYDQYLEKVNHGDDRAKELYNFIITKYPNSDYAAQSAILIKYVGLPDSVFTNDMLKKIEQQNPSK